MVVMMFIHTFTLCLWISLSRRCDSATMAAVNAGLDVADKAIGVINKGVDLASKVDKILEGKMNAHYESVAKRPESLVKPGDLAAIAKNMKPGAAVTFENLKGFDGIQEYQPPGWRYEVSKAAPKAQQSAEVRPAFAYPLGVGNVMMSGCFGSGYGPGDPCYELMRFKTRCAKLIDTANFIGVGFDITLSYTSESRKKSVIQRECSKKRTFMGRDVPDIMNAYGIYDYSIRSQSFQSVDKYRSYLAEKSGTQMSTGVFRSMGADWQKTSSVSSSGLLHDVGTAAGRGGSVSMKSGTKSGASLRRQMGARGSGSAHSFLAVLEADVKLYEIALDHSSPSDLSSTFLRDFFDLPTSYYLIGADIKLQDFVMRYGTHFVKSAKFGGKLNIFKSSRSDSKMSEQEFSATAETEFSSMMSTLQSSFKQSQTKVNVWGTGGKHGTKSRTASGSKSETASRSKTSTESGSQKQSRSEFVQTSVEVLGGDPDISAAIMDFYTPAFKERFVKWLASIKNFPKPYDMTFGKIADLFDVSPSALFKEGTPHAGCFSTDVKQDENGRNYFLKKTKTTDAKNNTVETDEKFMCKYGTNREQFLQDFKAKRLALEKAINIFMVEGPFSTSSFELPKGADGCESNTIKYISKSVKESRIWPKWADMMEDTFRVLFQLPFDIGVMPRKVEFVVRFTNGVWFSARPGAEFEIDNSCPSPVGKASRNRVCVAGLNLLYNENDGYFTFDTEFYKDQTSFAANVAKPFGTSFVARAEAIDILKSLQENRIGEIPCNVKWSNAHRLDPAKSQSCIHFSAASKGDIFLVFAAVPKDYTTWYYLQISPDGVAYYRAMELLSKDTKRGSRSLGDESLFETFFVCVRQGGGKKIKIIVGKAPAGSEIGAAHSAYIYSNSEHDTVNYYTFGSGEEKITVDDVRVIAGNPTIECVGEGLLKVNGECVLDCDVQCNGCRRAKDPKGCDACLNAKHFHDGRHFTCLQECPPKYEANANKVCTKCSAGSYKNVKGNQKCRKCAPGSYQPEIGQSSCVQCEVGNKCASEGLSTYEACPVNTFQKDKGAVSCTACPQGKTSPEGSTSCGNACVKGQYLGPGGCLQCAPGWYAPANGMENCLKCPVGKESNNERTSCQDINECNPNPCKNGAPCDNMLNKYFCKCTPEYKGTNCDQDVNECATPNICNNHGSCNNEKGSYTCKCNAGYQGKNCKLDVNECQTTPEPCSNRGTCVNTDGGFTCKDCLPGYKGDLCEVDVDECATGQHQCKYGTCVNIIGSYSCNCEAGYQGRHCGQVACHELGVDFGNAPLPGAGVVNVASWGACSQKCINTAGCRAWVYALPEFGKHIKSCWLKNGDYENVRKPLKGLMSGIVPAAPCGVIHHEITTGRCNSVSKTHCQEIASQLGLAFEEFNDVAFIPGCYNSYYSSPHKVWYNTADGKGLCSTTGRCLCQRGGDSCQDDKTYFNAYELGSASYPNVQSYSVCNALCTDRKECHAFSYAKGGNDKGSCWLKNELYEAGRSQGNDFVSGEKPATPCGELALINPKQSTTQSGFSAPRAIDGDLSTMSATQSTHTTWLEVELKHRARIDRMLCYLDGIAFNAGKYKSFKVETRMENTDAWKVCKDPSDVTAPITPYSFRCKSQTYAKHVKISISNNNLNMRELKVIGTNLYELELHNPSQMNVYDDRSDLGPHKAIDGIVGTASITEDPDSGANAYWVAELKQVARVARFRVWLSGYGLQSGKYRDFMIQTTFKGNEWKICWRGTVTGKIDPFIVECKMPMIVRKVAVSVFGANLYLHEIKVLGNNVYDMSVNMASQQSSTVQQRKPGNAVDGNFGTYAQTRGDATSWWTVTLKYGVRIDQILCYLSKYWFSKGRVYYKDFQVKTRMRDDEDWSVCKGAHLPAGDVWPYQVECEDPRTNAKYVRISIAFESLYLHEVQVYGS